MNSRAELNIGFKVGMIVFKSLEKQLSTKIFRKDLRKQQVGSGVSEEATIAPAFFMPFVTGTIALVFICLQKQVWCLLDLLLSNIIQIVLLVEMRKQLRRTLQDA
ncbi:unnamed protein product [Caenorhabditis angaria]|uniref:Uncharacterized protein n=1 Tax=Caenorhabditis angaria TaxID=860376 RepID=A0A9P1IKP6_9PELO|nr:unnamed protein product [Caenorhabditis angaria]